MRNPHRVTSVAEYVAYDATHFPTPEQFTANPRAYRREVASGWQRATIRARRKTHNARQREAEKLAGPLGTDHRSIRVFVAFLAEAENMRERLASLMAVAEWTNSRAKKALEAGEYAKAEKLNAETKDALEAHDRLRAEHDQVLRELRSLVSRIPADYVATYARLAELGEDLEENAVNVCRRVAKIEPKVRPPRTRATFAHAPPRYFATELRRSNRAQDS